MSIGTEKTTLPSWDPVPAHPPQDHGSWLLHAAPRTSCWLTGSTSTVRKRWGLSSPKPWAEPLMSTPEGTQEEAWLQQLGLNSWCLGGADALLIHPLRHQNRSFFHRNAAHTPSCFPFPAPFYHARSTQAGLYCPGCSDSVARSARSSVKSPPRPVCSPAGDCM